MMGDQFGGRSFTTIYKREQDKLANQFVAAEDLVAGMPVCLMPTGEVKALEEAGPSDSQKYIGINLYNVKQGEVTTVMILVSHVMVYAEAEEKLECGDMVTLKNELGDPKTNPDTSIEAYPHLVAKKSTGAPAYGLVLDNAEKGQLEVRVLILDWIWK